MLSRLFAMPENRPAPENGPTNRRAVALGAAAVAGAAVVSLLRTSGTGPLQSVFEEDARDVLTDALDTSTAKALVEPIAGYYVLGPRLLGELATLFPISWMPAVLSLSSAAVCGLLGVLVYVASGAHLPHRLARLLVAAPMLLAPVAENRAAEVYNRPVCLHFFALYALVWVLLWPAATRASRLVALVTAGLTAASTILAAGLVPLALLRLAARRDRHGLALAALVTAGAAVQVAGAFSTPRGRLGEARFDPLWAVSQYAGWALPESILGFRATSGLYVPDAEFPEALSRNAFVVVAAWSVVLLAVAVAVVGGRRGLLRPRWTLAAALAAHSAGLLALEIMANGWISQRYLLAPSMLLFAALVALLVPAAKTATGLRALPLAGLAALLLVTAAFNFRWTDTNRHDAPRWTDQVRAAAVRCNQDRALAAVAVRGGSARHPSYVVIPCHELRGGAVRCDGRTCVKVHGAAHAAPQITPYRKRTPAEVEFP
ncbi:hypothetical protein ACTMTJ_16845 [Phytohabitans sp. LJ34]|uniref:hypothetical protein n=1 Tax=Phytohabitans sp. LJ34 TaxID=3452217 RepID=UPI003F8B6AE1